MYQFTNIQIANPFQVNYLKISRDTCPITDCYPEADCYTDMPPIPQSDRRKPPPIPPSPLTSNPLTPNWLRSALSPPHLNLALFPPKAVWALLHSARHN